VRAACKAIFSRKYEKCVEIGVNPKKMLDLLSDLMHLLHAIHITNMKSKKNLTRFTYETAAFEGWRLCISRAGTTFTKYFPDKKYGGGGVKSLAAAEAALEEIKAIIEASKRIEGKLAPATIKKGEKVLADA